ncbi:MAG: cysteine--tRNA ligase [Oscillospiraceae bacterium]|nr:cysteine--tRNA ligase [Oscillospiraceae bacterium]
MQIYNTLTRQKEPFVPIVEGEVRIYACGPTVYNLIHIGNALPLCVFDTLRRFLIYRGYNVRYVQNFTDIEDKIIKKANEEGVPYDVITARYIDEYWTDAKGLNLMPATVHPRATEVVPEIIEMVERLIEKGFAYVSEGDVYFSTRAFDGYGKLSHQDIGDLEAGARIMVGETKSDPMDFALWKAAKPGEPSWDSPWGKGRPGWHIECSAMNKKFLGTQIDIHCGGQDIIFPHHENEIAQSECCNGVPLANYWMHNGYINVDHVKMSKSLGNFFTVREVAEKYGYDAIRFMLISSHYRSPVNFSQESVRQAKSSLQRIYTCRDNLEYAAATAPINRTDTDGELIALLETFREGFIAGMEDDLNTADALASVFDLVRACNIRVVEARASRAVCEAAAKLLDELTDVLGVTAKRERANETDAAAQKLIDERTRARKEKNWARADEIRKTLGEMGVTIEDTPQGTKIVH